MKIENHVVSLELAKQLKEAGYSQDTLFYWIDFGYMGQEWALMMEFPDGSYSDMQGGWGVMSDDTEIVAAPLASELGEQLPAKLSFDDPEASDLALNIWKDERGWWISYWWDEDTRRLSDLHILNVCENSESDARAKMWLYLKKEGLLPPPQSGEKGKYARN